MLVAKLNELLEILRPSNFHQTCFFIHHGLAGRGAVHKNKVKEIKIAALPLLESHHALW
jgi:hypothetical protein